MEAALNVFAAEGFAAARLDDVAERAGVAKGTIYLFFRDKEDLFEQIVRRAAEPVLERLQGVAERVDIPLDTFVSVLFDTFQTEVLGTRRKEILRLVMSEGRRFPRIAEFYHREVITRGLDVIRAVLERAAKRGEPHAARLAKFPQLVFAPLLLSVVWDGLFSSFESLDIAGLLDAHRALLTGSDQTKGPKP